MHWGSPGIGSIAIGALIVVCSSLRLGRSLTPFPEPVPGGRLTGTGPYRFVRHPMYLGVFFIAIGFADATHSITRAALAVGLAVFFDARRDTKSVSCEIAIRPRRTTQTVPQSFCLSSIDRRISLQRKVLAPFVFYRSHLTSPGAIVGLSK